mmetsp:Transcript_12228/g.32947  ORF Transcript_12228/g.32947 Transcript_12228/m.32947 type:complete len:407 (+) Transcript_12228:3-1223(+)
MSAAAAAVVVKERMNAAREEDVARATTAAADALAAERCALSDEVLRDATRAGVESAHTPLAPESPVSARTRFGQWLGRTLTPPRSPTKRPERRLPSQSGAPSADELLEDGGGGARAWGSPGRFASRSKQRSRRGASAEEDERMMWAGNTKDKSSRRRGSTEEDDFPLSKISARESSPTRNRVSVIFLSPRSSNASEERIAQRNSDMGTSGRSPKTPKQPASKPNRLAAMLKGVVSPRSARSKPARLNCSDALQDARSGSENFSVADTNDVDSSRLRRNWFPAQQSKSTRLNELESEFRRLDLISSPDRRRAANGAIHATLQYRATDKRPATRMNRAQKREAKVQNTFALSRMLDYLEPRDEGSAETDTNCAIPESKRFLLPASCELSDEPGSASAMDDVFPRSRST